MKLVTFGKDIFKCNEQEYHVLVFVLSNYQLLLSKLYTCLFSSLVRSNISHSQRQLFKSKESFKEKIVQKIY